MTSSITRGFAIWAFIPESREAWISSAKAFAVIAIIGIVTALGRFFRERICFVASYPFRRGIIISITQTSHIKNSCEPRKINSKCTKNDFKYPDYGVLNLILKISGIEARDFSTKSFISCSEIVKTSLAVLIRFSEKSDFFVNANALKFTQITLSLPKYTQKIKNSNVCS